MNNPPPSSLPAERSEALLLVNRSEGIALDAAKEALVQAARRQSGALEWEVSTNTLVKEAAIGDEVSSSERVPDLVLSVKGEKVDVLAGVRELRGVLKATIDPQSSSVLGARCHSILDGFGPVRIFYGLRRLPAMTREAFQDYWLHHHADVGRALIQPYSYRQSHADAAFTAELAQMLALSPSDFDGVASVHFPSLEACDQQLAREDVSEIAIADERRFIDHERVLFAVMATTKPIGQS